MHIRLPLLLFLLSSLIIPYHVSANQIGGDQYLLPIGGDYVNITAFTNAAIANAKNGNVNILVLPIGMASNAIAIPSAEREVLVKRADSYRVEIEQNCLLNSQPDLPCNISLAPIFTRSDARTSATLKYFSTPLSAVFILDGNQKIAMDVIGGTQLELALAEAYQQGAVISGTGAGSVIQSSAMIGGYNPGFDAENSLNFGALDLWNSAEKHGLLFGLQTAIFDNNFYQENHFGRLLNAITIPEAPPIGIGVDANTGARVENGLILDNVSGSGTVTILDAATYHANDSVRYVGADYLLSLRNVLVNVLAQGNYSYDLTSNRSSLQTPVPQLTRSYNALSLPPGAGPLWLVGDLQQSLDDNQILERFVKASGGALANILIVATGYPSDNIAESIAVEHAQALHADSNIFVFHKATAPQLLPPGYTGIILIGGEPSLIDPEILTTFKNAWLSGTPLLMENAAAAVAGEYYTVDPFKYGTTGLVKKSDPSTNKPDTNIRPGMGLVKITIQPGVMNDNLWGSVFSLAYNHPELINLGLNDQTAVEVGENGSNELGENVVFVLDLRYASIDLGRNNAYVLANGLLDAFAPGDRIEPQTADTAARLERQATPILATPTATTVPTSTPRPTITPRPTGTPTVEPTPTKRIKPSPTPLIIPPPSDPGTRSMMIAFGVLIALLIAIGVLINRKRLA